MHQLQQEEGSGGSDGVFPAVMCSFCPLLMPASSIIRSSPFEFDQRRAEALCGWHSKESTLKLGVSLTWIVKISSSLAEERENSSS